MFYRDLTEQFGFELETAGVLKQGRKFWALARTGQSSVLAANDVVNGYVLLATSCDGSLATVVTPTMVRVVCNNTLSVAVNRSLALESIKVPHNTVFNAAEIKRKLNMTVGQWDEFMLLMKELVKRKVSAKESEQFFRNVLSPATTFNNQNSEDKVPTNGMVVVNDPLAINTSANIVPFTGNNAAAGTNNINDNNSLEGVSLLDRIVTNTGHVIQAEVANIDHFTANEVNWSKIPNGRAIKKVQTLYEGHGRGAELAAAKGTAWGLLCAMTEFVDHERQARNQENRLVRTIDRYGLTPKTSYLALIPPRFLVQNQTVRLNPDKTPTPLKVALPYNDYSLPTKANESRCGIIPFDLQSLTSTSHQPRVQQTAPASP